MENSVNAPNGVIEPILLPLFSVNHILPSGPEQIPVGLLPVVGMVYSVKVPPVVTFATLLVACSTNHRFPSEPAQIPAGEDEPVGTVYSVIAPLQPTLPI